VIGGTLRSWAGLMLGLVVMAVVVAALHQTSTPRSGLEDNVVVQGRARGIEADAYFYTEVGNVRAFLDASGRYGVVRPGHSPAR
jgi:hypothetical protein